MTDLLSILADQTGVNPLDLIRLSSTAPRRYKVFHIKKRSGGLREIAQPAPEVKIVQRAINTSILRHLPVHEAAKAYRPKTSILDNARSHAGGYPLLKMDFKDFFPSIKARDWIAYCTSHALLSRAEVDFTCQFLFRKPKGERDLRLSIGAPSSPSLSNILMYDFDVIVSDAALSKGISYSRYADDLTFSGQRIGMLKDMLGVVSRATRDVHWPRLTLNDDKTSFVSMASKRFVTGVVLANDGALGIGRDRRRAISAKVHRAKVGKLEQDEVASLRGELAYVNVVEPTFLDWLVRKYGEDVIYLIKRG